MAKRIISIALCLILLVSFSFTTNADASINVTINRETVDFPGGVGPVIVNNRTLVPVRGVFEHLGFEVDWIEETRTAVLENDEFTVLVTIDSDIFTVNDVEYKLDVPAQLINERTMLPIRLVVEAVGFDVDWCKNTRTVIITTPAPLFPRIEGGIERGLDKPNAPRPVATGNNQRFLADALYFINHLESTHPIYFLPHLLCDEHERFRYEFIENASRATNVNDFRVEMLLYIRAIRDSKMSLNVSPWIGGNSFIHTDWFVQNNRLFMPSGAEVLAIGGICVQVIFDTIDRYLHFGNEATRRYQYAAMSRSQNIHTRAGALHTNSYIEIIIQDDDMQRVITERYQNGWHTSIPTFDYNIRYEMLDGVFYISLRSFRFEQPYHDRTIEAIRQSIAAGQRYFILDLRYNNGGDSRVGAELLAAMEVTLPRAGMYRVYNGEIRTAPATLLTTSNPNNVLVAVLTNCTAGSSATATSMYVQDGGIGVVVGQPTGDGIPTFGDTMPVKLPNTSTQLFTSLFYETRPDSNADPRMIHPDIHVNSDEALLAALRFFRFRNMPDTIYYEAENARLQRVCGIESMR